MSADNSSALAVVEPSHVTTSLQHHRQATDVAGLVRAIVVGKAVQIGPRKYVPVDAYQAIANAMGCTTSARDVKRIEGGYTAIGEVKRLSDGMVLAEGEGFVGDDEPKWAKGPEYARRSMVQTRAIGRACRAAFAFVVPMIDLGLSSTPAEEMEGVNTGTVEPPAPARGTQALKSAMRPSPPAAQAANEPPPHTDADFRMEREGPVQAEHVTPRTPEHDREFVMPFANKKGEPLRDLSEKSLLWFRNALSENVANPDKARFRDEAARQLALVTAEMKFRGLA